VKAPSALCGNCNYDEPLVDASVDHADAQLDAPADADARTESD
jgi:hypothetical protein